jgi:histone chaperone ASF1
MALVNILNVVVHDNPTVFTNPLQFEITFQCEQELQDGNSYQFVLESLFLFELMFYVVDLEWKVTYVGSAEDSTRDQVLEEVMVGPVSVGINRFVLQAASPNPDEIPKDDLLGVTVILVTCHYLEQEFIRIGYYVNNEPAEPYDPENPPEVVDINTVTRNILADQPRVTRIPINWNGPADPTGATFSDPSASMHGAPSLAVGDGSGSNGAGGSGFIINEDSMDVEQMKEIEYLVQ